MSAFKFFFFSFHHLAFILFTSSEFIFFIWIISTQTMKYTSFYTSWVWHPKFKYWGSFSSTKSIFPILKFRVVFCDEKNYFNFDIEVSYLNFYFHIEVCFLVWEELLLVLIVFQPYMRSNLSIYKSSSSTYSKSKFETSTFVLLFLFCFPQCLQIHQVSQVRIWGYFPLAPLHPHWKFRGFLTQIIKNN